MSKQDTISSMFATSKNSTILNALAASFASSEGSASQPFDRGQMDIGAMPLSRAKARFSSMLEPWSRPCEVVW